MSRPTFSFLIWLLTSSSTFVISRYFSRSLILSLYFDSKERFSFVKFSSLVMMFAFGPSNYPSEVTHASILFLIESMTAVKFCRLSICILELLNSSMRFLFSYSKYFILIYIYRVYSVFCPVSIPFGKRFPTSSSSELLSDSSFFTGFFFGVTSFYLFESAVLYLPLNILIRVNLPEVPPDFA